MLVLTSITKLQSALGTTQHIRAFDFGDRLLLVDGSSLFMVGRSGALDTSFSGDGVAFLAGANINGYNAVKATLNKAPISGRPCDFDLLIAQCESSALRLASRG